MLEYLHLRNVGPAPEMELELAPRLNLLTGDNGLGKSFLLDTAWWALTRRWPAEVNPRLTTGRMARPGGSGKASIEFRFESKVTKAGYPSHFDRALQAWVGAPRGRPGNPGLVLYAQVDGSFAVWDPARNYWRKKGDLDTPDRPPAYVFSPAEVWDGLPLEPGPKLCNGLINDWAGWQKERGEPFHHLATVLETLSPTSLSGPSDEQRESEAVLQALAESAETLKPGELTRVSLDDVRDMPTLRMPYGQDVPVVQASAGMRRIVALAYLLVWSWQEHLRASQLLDQPTTKQIVFLIDEVEAHLHPRWQRKILRSLLEVMTALSTDVKVQLIAATHSPLAMVSVEPYFDADQDAWFDLDLVAANGHAQVELKRRAFVRHGVASNWLTSEGFDLRTERSPEGEHAVEAARALLRRSTSPTAHEVRAVDQALHKAALPDIDPFWVRWSAFAEPYLEAAE